MQVFGGRNAMAKTKKREDVRTKTRIDGPRKKLSRKAFEKELEKLQAEVCHLQTWVVREGLKVVVVFEGRDAAGKGGVIKRITERVSPRVFRVVALPAPTEREKTQVYGQRVILHTSPPLARSSCSIAVGTTAPVLNASWISAPRRSTSVLCAAVRNSNATSSRRALF